MIIIDYGYESRGASKQLTMAMMIMNITKDYKIFGDTDDNN